MSKWTPLENEEPVLVSSKEPSDFRTEIQPMDWYGGALATRMAHIEAYTAAYLKWSGGLDPRDVELVETRKAGETTWHFRIRDK